MSIVNTKSVKCCDCGHNNNISVWQSLNTQRNPEAKRELLNGKLFEFKCANCGKVNNFCNQILYHDVNNKVMIYLALTKEEINDARSVFDSQKGIQNIAGDYKFRIVFSANELREKAIIFENNMDDRIVEIVKLIYIQQAMEQYPDLKYDEVLLYTQNDKYHLQIIGNHFIEAEMDASHYNDIKEYLSDDLSNDDNYIVDEQWAINVFGHLANKIDDTYDSEPDQKDASCTHNLICEKCGSDLPADSEFCQYCGHKLAKEANLTQSEDKQSSDNATEDSPSQVLKAQGNSESYGAKTLFNASDAEAVIKPQISSNKNDIKEKNSDKLPLSKVFSIVSVISMIFSVIAIIAIIVALNIQDINRNYHEYFNPTITYFILIAIFAALIVIDLILIKRNRFKALAWILPSFTVAVFLLMMVSDWSIFSWGYYNFNEYILYLNNYDVETCNVIWIIFAFAILLIHTFPLLVILLGRIKSKWHASVKYREKCYKRVSKIHSYCESGIITKEEYEKTKEDILKNISINSR